MRGRIKIHQIDSLQIAVCKLPIANLKRDL